MGPLSRQAKLRGRLFEFHYHACVSRYFLCRAATPQLASERFQARPTGAKLICVDWSNRIGVGPYHQNMLIALTRLGLLLILQSTLFPKVADMFKANMAQPPSC